MVRIIRGILYILVLFFSIVYLVDRGVFPSSDNFIVSLILLILFVKPVLVFHEFGHALMGVVVGIPIHKISIGQGPVRFQFRFVGIPVEWRRNWRAAVTYPGLGDETLERWRFVLFVAGGILLHSFFLSWPLLYILLSGSSPYTETPSYWNIISAGFLLANMILLLGAAIPGQIVYAGNTIPNDGLLILKTIFSRGEWYGNYLARIKSNHINLLLQDGEAAKAREALLEVLKKEPENEKNRALLAILDISFEGGHQALAYLRSCLEKDPEEEHYRRMLLIGLIWACIDIFDEESLALAKEYGRELEKLPSRFYGVQLTLGALRTITGEHEEGLRILRPLINHRDPVQTHVNTEAGFLLLLFALLETGNEKKIKKYVVSLRNDTTATFPDIIRIAHNLEKRSPGFRKLLEENGLAERYLSGAG